MEIESDIAPPSTRLARGTLTGALDVMEIGQSFAVPEGKVSSVRCAIHTRKSRKFSVRAMPDGSYRCWRVN